MDSMQAPTLPEAFWRHFVDELVPAAERLGYEQPVQEISLQIDFDNPSVSHVGQVLAGLDRWFRWGQTLAAQRDTVSRFGGPPEVHMSYPVLPKDFTLDLVGVSTGSLIAYLRSRVNNVNIDLAGVLLILEIFNAVTGTSL
ncbi:hypothetical protein [Streptomyces galilaeus]|uniref:hypothetical protein n=1 Tax=Streptomyces galilaeus TaxID=33899 RepID=UPI0038F663FE